MYISLSIISISIRDYFVIISYFCDHAHLQTISSHTVGTRY